jgi:hypothetical protein
VVLVILVSLPFQINPKIILSISVTAGTLLEFCLEAVTQLISWGSADVFLLWELLVREHSIPFTDVGLSFISVAFSIPDCSY